MADRFDPTKPWNQGILSNLKAGFPKACEGRTDAWLLEKYDEYSMSDMQLTFDQWVEGEPK